MKSFFSRLNDIQAGSSKPTKESSYKFWVPTNTNTERSPPKPIPVHPDVTASHGEKRSRALKSTHALEIPLHDVPTAPIETQVIHTNDMSRRATRPNPGSSSTFYSQNYLSSSSRTPRSHEHSDTRHQIPPHEAPGSVYPTGGQTFRETSSKSYRGIHESVTSREIWLPPAAPTVSKQVEGQTGLHVQGTSEKLERHREGGDDMDRLKQLERRDKNRERVRREREKEKERGKGHTTEHEREERERERSRTKERERGREKEREITQAKHEQDRNWEINQGRNRDKYAERDRREKERDSDREGEKRIKDKRSRKESSNLTRGVGRVWDSDGPYYGERTRQDERSKVRHRDRATGGGGKDDNRESHKERERLVEKESERARERAGRQIKHRVGATDGEQDAGRVRTLAPDRERQKDPNIGDTHTAHSRKLLRKTSNTLLNHSPGAEGGESSDSSTRPKRVQVLTKRHRTEASFSKIIHRQGVPAELLASTKSSAVKSTTVAVPLNSQDVQLPVPPTPQHMPIYLPPQESNSIDPGLALTIPQPNVISGRETDVAPRRETMIRIKSSRPDEPLLYTAENTSKPREVDALTLSRGSGPQSNAITSHPAVALKGIRESVYIHRPRHTQSSLTTVHDRSQNLGSSALPEIPHISMQAAGPKDPSQSLERLPDSRVKKEVEVDLDPSMLYKVQHRNPPQSMGAIPSQQPMESTLQALKPLTSSDPTPLLSNSNSAPLHKATHPSGSNIQLTGQTDPLHNRQLHNWGPAVMSGSTLVQESHSNLTVQVALSQPEGMDPPSNAAAQGLQSTPLHENIIQDLGNQAVATTMVSNTNEVKAVMQPQTEASFTPIKPADKSGHQLYTGLSIQRPSTVMDYRSSSGRGSAVRPYMTSPAFSVSQNTDTSKAYPLFPGWRSNANVISPTTLPSQESFQIATTSNVDVHQRIPPLKSSQSISNGQESIGIVITRPSTTTGFRQNTSGKSLRHHSNMLPDNKGFRGDSLNVISHPENFPSKAPTIQNPKLENLQTTPLAVTSPTSDDDLVKFHAASISASRQDSREAGDHAPSIAQNLHQAVKENSAVLQSTAPTATNNDSAGMTSLNAKASNTEPIAPPSGFTTPQVQPRRPATSLSNRNNSVLPSAIIAPQIQIHHLISSTGTTPHTDLCAGVSIPRTPRAGADLETSDIHRLAAVSANVLSIHVDQPQTFLGSGNDFHRPVYLVPTETSHMTDDIPSQTGGSSKEVPTQIFVNNHSATPPSQQPGPASSANQTRHDLVHKLTPNVQMNNDLTQGSPSLGFFNNTFSEVLYSPAVRRLGQGDHPATKSDGRKEPIHDPCPVSAGFETSRDDSTNHALDIKTSEHLVNICKVALSQIPSEVNPSHKCSSSPLQPRIQHPGLADVLSSPSRRSPSELRQKDVEQHPIESPTRQLQQTPTPTSRSVHPQNLHHGSDLLSLAPSKALSSLSHPSSVVRLPSKPYTTTSVAPDGITRPPLEPVPHFHSKTTGQSGTSYPEGPISTSGPSQKVEELASRKIRPPSIVDSKPLSNSTPHYRAATPLREPIATTRHQHSVSLPVSLAPSTNVPQSDGLLRSGIQTPLHHHSINHPHTKPGHTRPPGSQTLAPSITHAASASEETILMTPSSLAHSVKLKPTVSRQSVAPSMSSQAARKGTGIFTMFRSKTPAQPPPHYEIWHPDALSKSAGPNVTASGKTPSPSAFLEQKIPVPTPMPVPVASVSIANQKSKIFTPFRYLTTKRKRAVSLVSVEAQDGTAPSTVVGSPTASMHSQAPFQPPPTRDPMQATKEWRNKEEEIQPNGKSRRQRPGVVFDVAEEPLGGDRQRPKRTYTRHKGSSKPS